MHSGKVDDDRCTANQITQAVAFAHVAPGPLIRECCALAQIADAERDVLLGE
jgi:hypothetical protein